MATPSGSEDFALEPDTIAAEPLLKLLLEEPYRVQFFQAVRLLQRMGSAARPVGHFSQPKEEGVRFATLPSLAFPPSELYDLTPLPGGQYRMTVQFMGLCAALSALPATYVEAVLGRLREKDPAMADFFDLFNHRMLSLFYRAWQKHRFYIEYEAGRDDKLSLRLLDLLGLGTHGMRDRTALSDRTCIFYAGLLGRHIRTADSLRQILEDYLEVPVEIHEFPGTWRQLPKQDQTFLSGWGGTNEQLGVGTVVGEEVWDTHGRLKITLGPMPFERYREFFPGQPGHRDLAAWMQFYSDGSYETEVQLVLQHEEVPACQLGGRGAQAPRLGLASWLKTKPRTTDAGEAAYLLR